MKVKKAIFFNQLNEIEGVFNKLKMLGERVHYPKYKNVTAACFRDLEYNQVWEKCYEEKIYDFRLIDNSFIQFRMNSIQPLLVNYSYYECPYFPQETLEEFVQQQININPESDKITLIREYELLSIPKRKECVTPIRYDYDPSTYIESLHPASHIHFGYNNQIRIGTKNILRPISFILFIIRQYYPEKWKEFNTFADAPVICRNVSIKLDKVSSEYQGKLDNWEMKLI